MVNVNDFQGENDNEIIECAIRERGADGIVVIPPRSSHLEPARDWWSLDRAILLPTNTTVILRNCKLKLSDRCRDNFFRTANCGLGIPYPECVQNIHIKGEGLCVLEGANRPRATGDGGKLLACPCPYETEDLCRLADWIKEEDKRSGEIGFWDRHSHSYGTDFGKRKESQYGDWRGIGILFANVTDFSIENIKIVHSHGWGISMEACAYGRIERITLDSCMSKIIDGMRQNMENQDGIDIRNGCHDITVSDIRGRTGDDVIALTAIADQNTRLGGELRSTHVMPSDWTKRDKNIHDIIIRNVTAHSNLCYMVRLLPANAKIWNVVIDGIIDNSPDEIDNFGCILLGTDDGGYGKNEKDGLTDIAVSNVIANSKEAVIVAGYLSNSVLSNIISRNPDCPAVSVRRKDGLINVKAKNLSSASGRQIEYTKAPEGGYPV